MAKKKPFWRTSTFWIFVGLIMGVVLGGFFPQDEFPQAYNLFRFMSRSFIALIKGLIVPLLVSTIVVGIAQTGDIKAVGRMGGKALLYFEIVTTVALFLGLGVANWIKPGANLPLDLSAHTAVANATTQTGWDIMFHMFPSNVIDHAAKADILPVVVFAALFGIALTKAGKRGKIVLDFFDGVAQTMFKYTDMIMTLTPLGVFGAMAYNVSHMAAGHDVNGVYMKGWPAVFQLLKQYSLLVGSLYFALVLLFLLVFLPVAWITGIKIWGFIKAIRDPAITAYSTASSEAALPKLLEETVRFGVPRRVASFVIPTGYSFNLDGSTLYLVLASMTIAQAAHAANPEMFPVMSFGAQLMMVFTFMLTSKGVAGVPRATLVIIAATSSGFGLPGEAGIAMLLAVDEIMDMARTTINVIGNGLASVVIAKWEGVFGTETELLPDQEFISE
ncbi:MAG: cation:dicarboxylase symporter family transporter [Holophagaceae bacterium]|nr:cation:dicarboxylase symporter family transporter [Holophagaceae bacterium]